MKDAPVIWLWRGDFYKPLSPPHAEELKVAYVDEIDKMQVWTQRKFNHYWASNIKILQ